MPKYRPTGIARLLAGAFALVALVMGTQATAGIQPAEALTNCSVSDTTFDSQEQAFLQLINNYRAQNGRGPLTASVNLNRAASWMARDMAVKKYFSHTDSSGRSSSTRIANCDGKPYTGENIAAGTYRDTAQEAFDAWRNSSGHNANMLNANYKQIGIARYYDAAAPYRWYWVTDFSTSTDGTNALGGGSGGTTPPAPTPTPTVAPQPPASTSSKAEMISPVSGSTLSTSTTFKWTAGEGAKGYMVYIGTSKGASNMLKASVSGTQVTVNGFPKTGRTVYIRLLTNTPSGWQYNDYSYRLPR